MRVRVQWLLMRVSVARAPIACTALRVCAVICVNVYSERMAASAHKSSAWVTRRLTMTSPNHLNRETRTLVVIPARRSSTEAPVKPTQPIGRRRLMNLSRTSGGIKMRQTHVQKYSSRTGSRQGERSETMTNPEVILPEAPRGCRCSTTVDHPSRRYRLGRYRESL